jgi:DNA (cytosine-5)-methyltransferase 1
MKILELFGGIGACSKAFKRLGIPIEIADYVEIDKYAVKSYNAINGTNFEPQDIKEWNKDIEVDFIMHGSPCQDFSVAGLNKGGDKDSGTRSSLMYETIRIVEKLKPKYVLWENVKNLLSKKHIHNFKNYISIMNELGYNSYYQVLNSKDYGIPQNRERVFTLSIRQDIDNGTFTFPEPIELKLKLKDMLERQVDEKYFWNKHSIQELKTKSISEISYKWNIKVKELIDKLEANRTCSINAYNKAIDDISHTITIPHNNLFILDNNIIRKLTPKEYWRLMGFDDTDFEKAEKVNSNAQLYKQAGNSIVVNVLEAILTNLFLKDENDFEGQMNFNMLGDQ